MRLESENDVKTAEDSIKFLEEENMYLKQELDVIQRNLENESNERKSREKRLLDEVQLLEIEIDDLKKVNTFNPITHRGGVNLTHTFFNVYHGLTA